MFAAPAISANKKVSKVKTALLEKTLRLADAARPYDQGGWYVPQSHSDVLYFLQNRILLVSISTGVCKNVGGRGVCLPMAARYPLTLISSSPKSLTYTIGKNADTDNNDPQAKYFENKKLHIQFISDKKIVATFDQVKETFEFFTSQERMKMEGPGAPEGSP